MPANQSSSLAELGPSSAAQVDSEDSIRSESSNPITSSELAELAVDAPTTNGIVTAAYASQTMGVHLGLQEMVLELNQQVTEAQKSNWRPTESLLVSQATTLNAIFVEMARRAAANMAKNLGATEAYMRMALRAQSQTRSTLETLSNIKNPPVVVARQANITAGPQQVNNLIGTPCSTEKQKPPNQLSGGAHELRQNP